MQSLKGEVLHEAFSLAYNQQPRSLRLLMAEQQG